ncbi:cellulose biosynthesis protein BcsN [Methylobacterium planeticum]|uniref:Cellulose biosynthesis protein BcsN n=1 Tax=Methylobacterium planeticum TaxID=2615211 RepID=A0A6N6MTP5_9HYPH|nr:cellulose biosynthesis protein BcsN [Methylobacterium planeticum]KAB1073710.1 hypothetical protein F6X51_11010 [Methylobacterium planeticum]
MDSRSLIGSSLGRAVRPALALGLIALALPACNTTGNRSALSRRAAPEAFFSSLETNAIPAQRGPLVSLPHGGSVQSLQETPYANGRRQRISLEGADTTSRIEVMLRTGGRGGVPMERPTRSGIAGELAQLSSEGAYRIVRQPMRNRYGPFGVALSERCAYAWQWIDNLRGGEAGGSRWTGGEIAASLRIQHCQRRPSASQNLIADLQRLVIRTGEGPDVARVRRPRPHVAKVVEPEPSPVLSPAPLQPVPPAVAINGSRTLITVPSEAPRSAPLLTGEVPRTAAPQAYAGQGPQTFVVPKPAGEAGAANQPRFLTDRVAPPVERRMSEPPIAVPPPPARTAQPDRLSSDLPAQAYRGPAPPPFGW